jgi:hypothetical protein
VTTFAAGFIVLFGLLIVSTCLWSLFKPQWLFEFARPMLEQGWLMSLAVGIRVALGIALLLVAEASAFPLTFKILGGIALVAAVALPFIGMTRIKTLIDWMETLPAIAIRLWVVVGIALGGFLLLGVRPLFG